MHIISFYLNISLVSFLLCSCYGIPPKPEPFQRFSNQENELIFKILESKVQSGSYTPSVWKEIQKAHEEKLKAKVNGFFKRRTMKSLRQHFALILKTDKIKVPDALREFFSQIKRIAITPQEQDFINRELMLSGDDYLSLLTERRWKDMQNKHDKKRESGELGFGYKRSWRVLRNHFQLVMIPKNLVLESIKRKFPDNFKSKEGALSIEREGQLDNDSREKLIRYSDEENDLMLKMLESHALAGCYYPSVWREIQKAFEEKREAKATGFVAPRLTKSLRQNFLKILRSGKIPVPDIIWELYEQMKRINLTRQEQDLINTELARSDLPAWPLNANDRWNKIQEKHDEKRQSGNPSFANKRSTSTLRNHFKNVMKPRNLVVEAVKKRFPRDFQTNDVTSIEGEQSDTDPGENMECNEEDEAWECVNEEDDVWDPILEDLENLQRGPIDEYGVDHTMFLDPIQDNNIYMSNSPYNIRTF